MSAAIIPLPGAAAVPVLAAKLPPGRPPRNVASIRRGRLIRDARNARTERIAELEARARNLRAGAIGFAEGYVASLFANAAELEAQALALRGTSR